MRLLYLTADPGVPVFGHKGASVHVRELAGALERAGAEVVVASPRLEDEGGGRLGATAELVGIAPVLPRAHAKPASVRGAMAAQREEVERLSLELGIDAVYERYSLFSDAGVKASRRLGLPHVLEVNAPLRAEARRHRVLPHPRLAADVESEVFALTSRCLCVSEAVAATVRRRLSAAPTEVVPNGVDPARFRGPGARRDDDFVVGFAGSLKPWHGVEVLLEACSSAFQVERRLRLEIVGAGPMRVAVTAAPLPAERVRMFGPVDHARAIEAMRGWDAGVAPYLADRSFYFSPLKVLEYMATGICPVASDLGELRSLLRDARGLLVPPSDPQALSDALVKLARSPSLAREIGGRARAWVIANRSWVDNAGVVLDRLHDAAGKVAA